jgi:hypothetical protein
MPSGIVMRHENDFDSFDGMSKEVSGFRFQVPGVRFQVRRGGLLNASSFPETRHLEPVPFFFTL